MPPPFVLKRKMPVRSFSLNYKHVFTMEYLYKMLREWLVEEGYASDSDSDNGDRWMEKLYLERVAGNGGKQIWVWWRTSKSYPNSFFRLYINIDFHVLNMKSHEIVVNGQKVKTNIGECETFINAFLELDPAGGWDKNFFLKNSYVQNFYLNRIYKKQIEDVEKYLVGDSARLLGAIKQFFQLESWLPEYAGPGFHPPRGE